MTHKTVTYIPTEPFLNTRLLAAAWWASFFAATWVDILGIADCNKSVITFFAGAVLFSMITFGLDHASDKEEDD